MARKSSLSNAPKVVTLADLAPRSRIVGGSERRVFGSDPLAHQEGQVTKPKSARDLPAGKSVKGGKLRSK